MNTKTKIGLALIFLGLVSFVLGFVKFESREEVFRVGGFQATNTTQKTIPALRYLGIALFGIGSLAAYLGRKDRPN